jgi:hypothetical protein
MQPGS